MTNDEKDRHAAAAHKPGWLWFRSTGAPLFSQTQNSTGWEMDGWGGLWGNLAVCSIVIDVNRFAATYCDHVDFPQTERDVCLPGGSLGPARGGPVL